MMDIDAPILIWLHNQGRTQKEVKSRMRKQINEHQ